MHKNPVWLTLLGVTFAVVIWFSIIALYQVYNYSSIKEQTSATNLKWFVEEISSEDFRVGATYSFMIDQINYTGETIFNDRSFRNPSSADDELKIKANQNYFAFYDPQNIHHSSLQKKFPTKECISAVVLFLLFLYLIGLGIYTSKKSSI